jgi:hypothetical protein
MASLTAEIDETEAHSAMRELVRLSDGGRVHTYLTDRFAAFAREPSKAWRSPLKRALVAQSHS